MRRMSFAVVVVAAATLLTACGGGGSSDDDAIPLDGDNQDPGPPTSLEPSGDDVVSEPDEYGVVGELFGTVSIAYSFEGSEAVFAASAEFGPEDVSTSNDRLVSGVAATGVRLTENSTLDQGPHFNFGCTHLDSTGQVLCSLDPSGDNYTIFQFEPLSADKQSTGVFEFCNGLSTENCVNEMLVAPDGLAVLVVSDTVAAKAKSSLLAESAEGNSVLPYLQYHEQAAASITVGNGVETESFRLKKLQILDALSSMR